MKEIIAIIRPNKWMETKAKLFDGGFVSFTVQRVYGRGRQKGLRYLSRVGKIEEGISYLPKRLITLFVRDEDLEDAVKIIIETNQTGEIGDGKIFVCDLEGAQRIRSEEKGEEIL